MSCAAAIDVAAEHAETKPNNHIIYIMFVLQTQEGNETVPLTTVELQLMLRRGEVPPSIMARRHPNGEWRKLYSYGEFFAQAPVGVAPPVGSYSAPPFISSPVPADTYETYDIKTSANEEDGPYTVDVLRDMLKNGIISHQTLARKGRNSEWVKIGSMSEFLGVPLLNSRPPIASYSPVHRR